MNETRYPRDTPMSYNTIKGGGRGKQYDDISYDVNFCILKVVTFSLCYLIAKSRPQVVSPSSLLPPLLLLFIAVCYEMHHQPSRISACSNEFPKLNHITFPVGKFESSEK